MATVFIPSLMQKLTDGQGTVEVSGSTVREIITNLNEKYPGIQERIMDKHKVKANISVAVDGEVSPIGALEKVGRDSEIHFLPAIGGGTETTFCAPVTNFIPGIDSEHHEDECPRF